MLWGWGMGGAATLQRDRLKEERGRGLQGRRIILKAIMIIIRGVQREWVNAMLGKREKKKGER